MKTLKRDLMDHLVFLVIRNAEPPPSEEEVRHELEQEFRRFLSEEHQPSVR